jgi:tetratricopeptide (TPR) repeat protein
MSRKSKRSLLLRRLAILGGLTVGIIAVFAGILWIQDAPLRDAQKRLSRGDSQTAAQVIRTWEKIHSPTGRSQALLARSLAESGDFYGAIKIFESVGAANAVELHSWAKAYLSVHQWSSALPLLNDLRTRDHEDADVLHELAACQAKLGMLEDALETANEFKTRHKYAHRAWLLIGVIHTQRGNKTAAVEAWKQIEEYDPEYQDLQLPAEEFLTQFASLQIELGHTEEASKLLGRALSIRETAEAQFQAGLAADLNGDQSTAKQRWQRALELDSVHRNARESLARLAIAAGDADAALAQLSPIVSLDSNRSSTTYLMQRVAQLQGDSKQAIFWQKQTELLRKREAIDSTVNRLLTEDPNSYWAQVVRSYQFAERGDFPEAQQLLERIKVENEDSFVTSLRIAVASRGKLPDKYQIPIKHF